MVPLSRHASVGGIPITDRLPADRIQALIERTRKGWEEILALEKVSSACSCLGRGCGAPGRSRGQGEDTCVVARRLSSGGVRHRRHLEGRADHYWSHWGWNVCWSGQ